MVGLYRHFEGDLMTSNNVAHSQALIEGRYSCRAFTNQKISRKSIEEIVQLAQRAPSSKNTQPWKLSVLSGKFLQDLSTELITCVKAGQKPQPDYLHSPDPLPDLWMERARKCGFDLFKLKGIGREDREARNAHNLENFTFFGAQQIFVLYTDVFLESGATKGNYLDCGLFLQNLWLAIRAFGLEACAQYSVAAYPQVLRKHGGIPEKTEIICSLCFGYPDNKALVNTYRTERAPLNEVIQFFMDA